MEEVLVDLSNVEDSVITVLQLAQETLNEMQNLPDVNNVKMEELSVAYIEKLKELRTSIFRAHAKVNLCMHRDEPVVDENSNHPINSFESSSILDELDRLHN